ncbi:AAA family ATPase, partial [Ferruginibacter sp.]
MSRSDLLLQLVQSGGQGDKQLFRKVVEAIIAEEKSKQHNIFANKLQESLQHFSIPEINGKRNVHNMNGYNKVESNSDLLHETVPLVQLDDLILNNSVKKNTRDFIEEQLRADLLRSYNMEPRNRIMLIGPPGNGKTSLAEAIASSLMLPLLTVRYESIIASYLGETSIRLRNLFDYVRTQKCVLFFDEFDSIGKERGDTHETGEIKRVVSSLLLQIDKLPSYVTIIGATNHPELLDRA